GVAATVDLTPDQAEWYLMSDEAVPHVSLSLHPEHQAKVLGGVVKRSLAAGDWHNTSVTNLRYSKSTDTYCINVQLLMKSCCSMRCSHVIMNEKKQIIPKLQLFCSTCLLSYGLKGTQM
ncbi:hypothetical protein AMECASPLE_039654, partial [Ameca splendens]